jgi:hypothetical protein
VSQTYQIEFKKILSVNFLLIFLAVFLSTIVDQALNKQIETVIRAPTGLSNMIWFWGATSLASSLFFPLMITMLCCYTLASLPIGRFKMFSDHFELALIETLRSWGKTFLWCFVFIIPGLIKYTFYILSPFVVFFSKKYAAGQVDALEYSEVLTKKFWWRLNLWLTIFYFIIPIALSSLFDEYKILSTHPVSATLCVLFETLMIFCFHFLILKLFIKYLDEVENGAHV